MQIPRGTRGSPFDYASRLLHLSTLLLSLILFRGAGAADAPFAKPITGKAIVALDGSWRSQETSDGELRAQMETNFFGAMNVMRAALPVLRAQKHGAIVNVSSLGGQLLFAGFSVSMRHMAVLEAYREAIAETRNFAKHMHGTQEGDPHKAAAAIEAALDSPNTPLRLQLGADSVDAIRSHSETLLKDLATWDAVARATAFDEVATRERA